MKQTLCSIIIPIYNVEEYIDKCVESACGQTYKNLEIILVDDGSPDDCPEKCDLWAQRDSRIRVIHKKNGGLSDARNAGLDVATGKYVYFLDGDDYINPELIETAIRYMNAEADMVAFQYDCVYPDGEIEPVRYHELGLYNISSDNRLEFIIQKLLAGRIGWEAWSRMYSREIIEKHQLRFADNRQIFAEDLFFCLCYCAHAKKVVSIEKSLYYYVQRENSIMGRDGRKLNIGRINELGKVVLTHFSQSGDCKDLVKNFSLIHYGIVSHIIFSALKKNDQPLKEFRQRVLDDIEDDSFFYAQIRPLLKSPKYMRMYYQGVQFEEQISFMRYLLNGNLFALRLRNRALYLLWDVLEQSYWYSKKIARQYRRLNGMHKRVFLLGTEEFGNIGDHQINESMLCFLKKTLPDFFIHEVTAKEWRQHKGFLRRHVRKSELIVFAGGGNFGDVYGAQRIRNEVIRCWPKNPKIVFPQTVFFTDSEAGKAALQEAKELYSKENNVVLFAREQDSYVFCQNHFECDSYLVPDIVLSSQVNCSEKRERQILLCLRSDLERAMDDQTLKQLQEICLDTRYDLSETDLQLDYHLTRSMRVDAIRGKMDEFKKAGLVITDRLHGMIFAAITGTPCIAFSNYNHKVRGTYDWIKYLPYIRLAETVDEAAQYLPELLAMEPGVYDNTPLLPYFEKLAKVVKEYAGN